MKKLLTVFISSLVILTLAGITFAAEPSYVGGAKCKMCHMKQFKVWEGTKHAKAFDALKPEEQKDPKCIKCHTTGPEGKIQNIECEACHGAGSEYKAAPIMKDKEKAKAAGLILGDEQTCKKCHNEESPTFKGFNFKEAWEKIKHPKAPKE